MSTVQPHDAHPDMPARLARSAAPAFTAQQKLRELQRTGKSIRQYAADCGVKDERLAYQLLSGYLKGNRGKAHIAAVKLGIQAGEILTEKEAA